MSLCFLLACIRLIRCGNSVSSQEELVLLASVSSQEEQFAFKVIVCSVLTYTDEHISPKPIFLQ
jgi:hypothetical protein